MDQPTTLPAELKLAPPPTIPQARSYLLPIQSLDAEYDLFSNAQDIQIDIPRLQRSYLSKDSYLGFRVTVEWQPGEIQGGTGSPEIGLCFDTPGAFGLFDSIEVYDYLGSTLLERINSHAELMSLLIDANPLGFGHPTTNGTRSFIASSADNPPYQQYNPTVTGPVSGDVFHSYSIPSTSPVQIVKRSKDYAIPLASFLGFLSKKMVPLHNGFTLLLKWNHPTKVFGVSPLGDQTTVDSLDNSLKTTVVSNVKFYAQILELGPVAEGLLQASTSGEPMIVHTRTYRNYNTSWGESSVYTEKVLDLNINVASMTGILWQMREQSNGAPLVSRRKYQRIRNYLEKWSFKYGSSTLPHSSGIETRCNDTFSFGSGAQGYIELTKALRSQSKHTNFSPNSWNLESSDGYDGSVLCPFLDTMWNNYSLNSKEYGRFACGLNLQLIPYQDTISGLNTNGITTQIHAKFNPVKNEQTFAGTGIVVPCVVDAWVEYDAFVSIVPGIMTTVSF